MTGDGVRILVRVLVSVGLLAYLATQLDLTRIDSVLADSDWLLLAAAVGVIALERVLGAFRWHLLLTCIHATIPWRIVFKATFISGFFGNFLPGLVGTEVLRVATITRSTRNLSAALSTVVFDRALGALALAGIASAAILVAPVAMPPGIALGAAAMLTVLLGGLLAVTSPRVRPVLLGLVRSLCPRVLRGPLQRLIEATELIAVRRSMLVVSVALAVMYQLMRVVVVIIGAFALGYGGIPLIYFLLYVPIILVVMLLPLSLGGLGVREAGFVYFFGAEFMPAEAAFTLSLITYVGALIAQAPGVVFWIRGIERHAGEEAAISRERR
jgi:uncharacterized protein (TIRG00374 family)